MIRGMKGKKSWESAVEVRLDGLLDGRGGVAAGGIEVTRGLSTSSCPLPSASRIVYLNLSSRYERHALPLRGFVKVLGGRDEANAARVCADNDWHCCSVQVENSSINSKKCEHECRKETKNVVSSSWHYCLRHLRISHVRC